MELLYPLAVLHVGFSALDVFGKLSVAQNYMKPCIL